VIRSSGGKARSKAVQGILNAAKTGGELSKVGILGRLGDLATIPEQYDVAISTACGGMLDNIVVQTTAGAQRCLEFLRKYNLGRASFIPLDKQKKGAHDRSVETPENAPRLFDMIVPSNFSVTPALFLAVGNTLVAPEMDTATRWAYDSSKRWRVVTLNGNLIETTGTMSGGGKTARSGGMRIAVSVYSLAFRGYWLLNTHIYPAFQNSRTKFVVPASEDAAESHLERIVEEAQQAHDLLQESHKRRQDMKNEVRSLVKIKKSLEVMIPKLKLEIEGCEISRKELTKLIPDLRAQCEVSAEDQEKKIVLAAKVETCRSEMKHCAELAAKLEAELSKLQRGILEAGGARLQKQRHTCEQILSDLNAAEKTLNASKVELSSSEKAESKARATKIDLETKLCACEESLQQKEAEFKALETGALEVMTAYEQVKIVEAEKRAALDSVSKEADELKKLQSEVRCKEIDLLGQVDAIEKQLSDHTKKLHHWEKEVARLWKVDDEFEFEDAAEKDEAKSNPDDIEMENSAPESDATMNEDHRSSKPKSMASLSHSVLEKYNADDIREGIATLEAERNMLAKNANMGAIAEYRKKEADYLSRYD
jgi:structural maintenance of chromosome 4